MSTEFDNVHTKIEVVDELTQTLRLFTDAPTESNRALLHGVLCGHRHITDGKDDTCASEFECQLNRILDSFGILSADNLIPMIRELIEIANNAIAPEHDDSDEEFDSYDNDDFIDLIADLRCDITIYGGTIRELKKANQELKDENELLKAQIKTIKKKRS